MTNATSHPAANDAVCAMIKALDAVSVHLVVLDRDGRCAHVSPCAEALVSGGSQLTLRRSRLQCSKSARSVADCPRTGGPIDVNHDLEPCIGCVTRGQTLGSRTQRCSIAISCAEELSMHLRLTPVARADQDSLKGAAAVLLIEPVMASRSAELLPEIAIMLTVAEREVATELLSGRRPTEIAQRRQVSVGTIRSQIKRIYAKLEVSGLVEFIAKARR
jgi:DNA-binding CsgD family transcriptional regulator